MTKIVTRNELQARLAANSGLALETMIDRSPALNETRPLAKDLSAIGVIGLEALGYLTNSVAPPPEWRDASLAVLEQAAKPKAAVEFAVIPSLRQLVVAAAEQPRLKTMSAAEWKRMVASLATPEVAKPK